MAPNATAAVVLGYDVDRRGNGVLYGEIGDERTHASLRVSFAVPPFTPAAGDPPGADEAAIAQAFAAVAAVAAYLRGRGFNRLRLQLDAPDAVDAINGRGAVHPVLALAYVRTRAALHAFSAARVEQCGDRTRTDALTERARCETQKRAG